MADAVPSLPPKQLTVVFETVINIGEGSVISGLVVARDLQPLAPVTVTVYEPAVNPVVIESVPPAVATKR